MKTKHLCALILWLSLAAGIGTAAESLSLAGPWRFQLDPTDIGMQAHWENRSLADTIELPNSTATAGKGNPLALKPKLDESCLDHLQQRFSYIGPAWYQCTIQLPSDWSGKNVQLVLERVLWDSVVWLNGRKVGDADSLCAPHRFDLTPFLRAGRNVLTIRVDNRKKYDIGIGTAYTEETQTIWNGIIGRIELKAFDPVHIQQVHLAPDLAGNEVAVTLEFHNCTERKQTGRLALAVAGLAPAAHWETNLVVAPGVTSRVFHFSMGTNYECWSEFHPQLYSLQATLDGGGFHSQVLTTFGMREFKAQGRQLMINGQPTFLRGTLECCVFPKTGHPSMDAAYWNKIFSTARAYGLNFIRFHSWCPPDVAFRCADRHGFYLQVELPNWSFHMGQNPPVDAFFRAEGERILREYGNHPSFVMLSMGNELEGDTNAMDALVAHLRQLDPTRLYTSTSFSFSPRGQLPGPEDDYFITQQTACGWVRGQGFLNSTRPNTESDYSPGLSCVSIPLVAHEVGQYCVYPDLAELPEYNGALRNLGFEAIRDDLKRKGLLADAPRFTRDSGRLAAILYKEDIERALRTKDQAGLALLDLHDFPGQGTATVGLLDAFWDSKGIITPEAFRRFCAPVVPLARVARRVWQNDETFAASVEMANFGPGTLTNAAAIWELLDGSAVVGRGTFPPRLIPQGNGFQLGEIRQPLDVVRHPARLKLVVKLPGTDVANDWSIWVYPTGAPPVPTNHVAVLDTVGPPLYRALRTGKRVLLLPPPDSLAKPLQGRFIPVFWSPLHFPDQPGTLGATIEPGHPVFGWFPTGTSTDWQWWGLLAHSVAADLSAVQARPVMPFRFVDKFNRNALPAALFEVRVGSARLFVCTLDVSHDLATRPAARQLRRSLLAYVGSRKFQPMTEWTEADVRALFVTNRVLASASSAYRDDPARLAVDGNPSTFWHSDWEHGGTLPAYLQIDCQKENWLRGFNYTPRQDMDRGRIEKYSVEVSADGQHWQTGVESGSFPNITTRQTVLFSQPFRARYLRLTAYSDYGGAHQAAVAEIKPIIVQPGGDARTPGTTPDLNDQK